MSIRFTAGSLRATIVSLGNVKVSMRQAGDVAIEAAGRAYLAKVKQKMSLTDHSLKDLARLDHPYARRHGSIRIHRTQPFQVHTQSGQLLGALGGTFRASTGSRGPTYTVGLNAAKAPHAAYVIKGTRVMLPRDTIRETGDLEETRREMMRTITGALARELKAQAVVRFGRS